MFVMVLRTVLVRIRPTTLLSFKPNEARDVHTSSNVVSRFWTHFKEDGGVFSWADKGQWETVETTDGAISREANWFRIGFEPLFVDFTQSGAWFIVVSLIEVRTIAFMVISALYLEHN